MTRRRLTLLLVATTLLTDVGCRNSCRRRDRFDEPIPRDRRLEDPVAPGVIPPTRVPDSPGFTPGGSLPAPDLIPRRDTFSPGPIRNVLPWNQAPLPPVIADTPPVPQPAPLVPQTLPPLGPPVVPDSPPKTRTEYTPMLPSPDRTVMLEPIAPRNNSDLPEERNAPPVLKLPIPSNKEILLPEDQETGPIQKMEAREMPGRSEQPTDALLALGTTRNPVMVGRKPNLDRLDRLQKDQFRTAIYLHAPGEETRVLKELFEKRGITLVPIAITPQNFAEVMSKVVPLLNDTMNRPVFLFDDSGVRVGSVMYAYFRTVEVLNAEQAQIRARPLGLQDPEDSAEQKLFWLAIQTYLSRK